ncbi:fibronectin type III domain-containing protein [Marinobacter mobilis]|uniref:fibronectin type III domain-containing protein n=1 Tax=Marinobacter mobilis TaxID=488533 RepID=UPI0035C68CDA
MPDMRHPWLAARRLSANLSLLVLATALALLSGCKQGSTDSYSSTTQSAPLVAAQRESSAISSFRQAFGDESQPADTTPASGSGGNGEISDSTPSPHPESRPTLSWSAPLTRENGESLALSEISGYRVRFRLRHREAFQSIMVEGAENTRLSLDRFDPGAYEFSVSVVDSQGRESAPSGSVAVDLI